MRVLGCDPGLDGGLALLSEDGLLLETMPVAEVGKGRRWIVEVEVVRLVRTWAPQQAFIERVTAMPSDEGGGKARRGMGTASAFNFGMGFGLVLGVLSALEIGYSLVQPRTWQQAMGVGGPTQQDRKASSRMVAQRLFPAAHFKATPRARQAHSGLADAALIAEYGRRTLAGGR